LSPPAAGECVVYVLGHAGARRVTYVGWTNDLQKRVESHNAGHGARTTRGRNWTLLYWERCDDRRSAMRREWRLKRDRAFRMRLRERLATA
jgi:putative endonuclease